MTARKTDSAKVDFSLASLDVDTSAKPVRVALRGNKVIEFENFQNLPYKKTFALLEQFETDPVGAIENWLSEDDRAVWEEADLTTAELTAVLGKLGEYISAQVGNAPKDED